MSVRGDNSGGDATAEDGYFGDHVARLTAPPELEDAEHRKKWGLGEHPEDRGPYMVELNVEHMDGLAGAATAFVDLFAAIVAQDDADATAEPWYLVKISKSYFRCEMNVEEWKKLLAADERRAASQTKKDAGQHSGRDRLSDYAYRSIYKLWPDFPVQSSITRSAATIKADAALRSFDAAGEGITWAIIDSGIDASHAQFGPDEDHVLNDPRVRNLHRCFAPIEGRHLEDPDEDAIDGSRLSREEREKRLKDHQEHALQDPLGHGTHVAGIIAGRIPRDVEIIVLEKMQNIRPSEEMENLPKLHTSTRERMIHNEREHDRFHGIAPDCRLVSLRALDERGEGRSSNLVRALEYIREKLNDNPRILRVHGVNLSVGYEFDAEMFACGQSPLCTEVNRLVRSGVVVVTAAGNTGYSTISTVERVTKVGLSSTINDPGNSEDAITVGSTHRDAPHTFGISYFSSKGPTGDGRLKPDLVAPGERIISCAAGSNLTKAIGMLEPSRGSFLEEDSAGTGDNDSDVGPLSGASASVSVSEGTVPPKRAYYVEDSGTSMAAPHVSGAIAAFLSVRREFIGHPLAVKKIFLDAALPLGRERYFEGHGLVDLMRAIQSV